MVFYDEVLDPICSLIGGVVVNVLDCDIVVSEFELQLRYYVQFWTNNLGKGMKPIYPFSSVGLKRTTTVF